MINTDNDKKILQFSLDLNNFPDIKNLEIINTSFLNNLLSIDNALINNIDKNKVVILNNRDSVDKYVSLIKMEGI